MHKMYNLQTRFEVSHIPYLDQIGRGIILGRRTGFFCRFSQLELAAIDRIDKI